MDKMDKMDKLESVLGLILGAFVTIVFFMVAWNYIIPEVFGLAKLNLLQSFALLFVSSCLFKPLNAK